jgi:hypothetical protein
MESHREVDGRTLTSIEQSRPIEIAKIISRATASLRLGSLGAMMACAIAAPSYGQERSSIPTLPECTEAGQTFTLDLSTGATNGTANAPGIVDPKWQVFSAPTATGLTNFPVSPFSIPPYTGFWATPTAPSTWIEPWPGTSANLGATAVNGLYQYGLNFNIPHPLSVYTSISLAGQCRVDDGGTLWLNSSPTQSCGPFSGTAGSFSFIGPASFQAGANTFHADVQNTGGAPTGLMIAATLKAVCKTSGQQGILKVCKVAGPGITVGTPFSYTAGGSNPFTVPAGAAPGGTCVIGPSFPVGATVNVVETIPPNDAVSTITVAPPANLVSANPTTGTASVHIGSGVTEVTYTNINKPGFLEICKRGSGSGSFTVTPGNLGPFVIAAGTCSPAIQVNSGSVTIKETPGFGTLMSGCATLPASRQGPCNTNAHTSVVTVVPGDVSVQTIAIITNKQTIIPTDDNFHGQLDNIPGQLIPGQVLPGQQ